MRLEIESAANFLSNLLRLHANLLSVDQLEVFRESIFKLLTTHYQQHWFPENPFKGSGYRCLRINHKMDPIIAKAGSNCGLDESKLRGYLPNELTLWIDPREVSYRIGENGSICVLFDAESSSDTKSDDEGSTSSTSSSSSSLSSASSWHKLPQSPKSQSNVQNCRMNTSSPSGSSVSSTASTLSSPSPSSSPDWSLSDRKSPISAYSGYQHYSPQQNQYHHQTQQQQQYHHHPQQYQQHNHHHQQQQQQLMTGSPNSNSNNNNSHHHHSSTTNHHQQQQQHHHSGNVNTANNSGSNNSNKDWNNYLHLQNAIQWEALLHTGRSMYREQPNPVSVMTGPSWWRR